MGFTYKGKQVDNITLNGTPLDRLQIKGVTVWERITPNWEGFKFIVTEATTIAMMKVYGSSTSTPPDINLEYSKDNGRTWTEFIPGTTTISGVAGDEICMRGDNTAYYSTEGKDGWRFNIRTGAVNLSGNINSLLLKENFDEVNTIGEYALARIFLSCSAIRNAADLLLPAIAVGKYGYYYMFWFCTNLLTAPVLPATNIQDGCYISMFESCSRLVTAPKLPATSLAPNCYQYMFRNCTSLKNTYALPATVLRAYCYSAMFMGCDSLEIAPEIMAKSTLLVTAPLAQMFYNCSSLRRVTINATLWNTSASTNWLYGVARAGTFYNLGKATGLSTGSPNAIPAGWDVYTQK